jgi:hypothetical protein
VSGDGKAANHVVKLALTLAYYRLAAARNAAVLNPVPQPGG